MRSSKVHAILLLVLGALCGPFVVQCRRDRKNSDRDSTNTAEQCENLANMIQPVGEAVANLQREVIQIARDLSGLEHLKNSLAEQRCLLTSRCCAERQTGCECCETKRQDECRIPETNASYCSDIKCKKTGIYMIQPENPFKQPMAVLCDQDYESGGWTVIQYRFDGSVDFYRGWKEYENGFGSYDGEFWLGLKSIHQLTASRPHELVVVMVDVNGERTYARYERFAIGDASQEYELKTVGGYSGTATDQLEKLQGQKFSTLDNDNDSVSVNCAIAYKGAWWHKNCYTSNLNGEYVADKETVGGDQKTIGMVWKQPKALKFSKMMIRPKP